jgi:hypothetical protein
MDYFQSLFPIFSLLLNREIVTSYAIRRITGVFHICANFYINLSLVITELEVGADWQSFELHIPVQFACPIYMSGTVRDFQWGLTL